MHLFNGMLVATVEATDKVGAGALEVSIDGLENVKTEFTVFNNKTEN
jgi:hypothetical protein